MAKLLQDFYIKFKKIDLASRNFITTPNVTSLLIMHAGMRLDESEICNYNELNFQMIVIFNSLLES